MKKTLLSLAVLTAGLFSSINSKAQLQSGSVLSSNMVLTDINGNTHDIFAYLNAGKTVVIDISATWCSPCWAYHQTHKLDSLQDLHGIATGTNNVAGTVSQDFVVLFIEGDPTTNSADLHGATTGTTSTQGDWVTGTTFPIIDISANSQIAPLNISFFPTQYIICPDRMVRDISPSTVGFYPTVGQFLAWRNTGCSFATATKDAGIMNNYSLLNQNLSSCDSVIGQYRLTNYGTTPLTSATIEARVNGTTQKTINWTGSLATYASVLLTAPKVGSNSVGTKTLSFVVTNSNGSTDAIISNNTLNATFSILSTIGGGQITEGYEAGTIPANHSIVNPDADITWAMASTGYSSSKSLFMDFWNYAATGQKDEIVLNGVDFTGQTTGSINFDVAYTPYGTSTKSKDSLKIYVSTNCGTTWTKVWNKASTVLQTAPQVNSTSAAFTPTGSAQWRHESVNLSSYAGNSNVIVKFQAVNDYGDDLYLDNINISFAAPQGIKENELVSDFSIAPNPTTTSAIINMNLLNTETILVNVYNNVGQVVSIINAGHLNAGQQNIEINTTDFAAGIYVVNVLTNNGVITRKLVVSK
jgi:hypothetical protein